MTGCKGPVQALIPIRYHTSDSSGIDLYALQNFGLQISLNLNETPVPLSVYHIPVVTTKGMGVTHIRPYPRESTETD